MDLCTLKIQQQNTAQHMGMLTTGAQPQGPQTSGEQQLGKQPHEASTGVNIVEGVHSSQDGRTASGHQIDNLRQAGSKDSMRVAAHWGRVLLALLLTFAAALSKEIGITVVGAMLAYDILLVPLVSLMHVIATTSQDSSRHASSNGSSTCRSGISYVSRLLLQERKLLRMALCVSMAVCYVRLRSWVAVDQLVRIYRKVDLMCLASSSSVFVAHLGLQNAKPALLCNPRQQQSKQTACIA